MPVTGIRNEFELETRDRYTKVKAELGIKVDGRELPNMAILGEALEEAIELIRNKIKESYVKVPERPKETEVANPYATTQEKPAFTLKPGGLTTGGNV